MEPEFDYNYAIEHVAKFVDGLFSFNVLMLENCQPDIQVIEVGSDKALLELIHKEFGVSAVQSILPNMDESTKIFCPYFRVITSDFGQAPINFKLQTFLNKIKLKAMNARCSKALVVGLSTMDAGSNATLSVPYDFCTTTIDNIGFFEKQLDFTCLKPCAPLMREPGTTLCDIAGVSLPYHVPWEIQCKILSYMRSPTADLIHSKLDELCLDWDSHLFRMWSQREPRIPAHIACYYHAATVQATVADATSPFLACSARTSRACPTWMNMPHD